MSPIDPLGPLLAQIRSQATGLKRKEGARPGPRSPADETAGQSATKLMDGVIAEVATLSSDLPDRRRRAFRIFLKAVLANELVIEDRSASAYEDLVDRVLESMEADGRLHEAIDRGGASLLDMAGR